MLAVGLVWLIGGCLGSFVWWFCSFYFDDCWVCAYFRDEPARATLSFYRGIFDLFGRASKPIPLQFLLMGFSIMILLLRHSFRGHTFNSLFHDTYACVAIIGS